MLAGCGKFFVPVTSGGGGCTTNCNTNDFLYVANQNTTTPSLAGFSFATGSLTAVASTPYALSILPTSMVVNPANTFLYVGGLSGSIFLYAINSNGTLTAQSNGNAIASTVGIAAMKIDATGSFLITANEGSASVSVFAIDRTTGALTLGTGSPLALTGGNATGTGTQALNHLLITPNNQFIYVSEGTAGVDILSFNATTGAVIETGHLNSGNSTTNSDQGLATDPSSKFLFVTETGVNGVRVFTIGTTGAITELASGSPFKTGLGPTSVLVDASGSYVYVTNRTDNTISGFVLAASGALTALTGSPFATGANPVDLIEDRSKTYLATANNGGNKDLHVYTFSTATPGALVASATATTGTDPTLPVALAATH